MNIKPIESISTWTNFFDKNGSETFLQSWEWGELQKKNGHHIFRLGIYNKKLLIGIAQVIHMHAKRGNFLFVPHGPIGQNRTVVKALTTYLIELGKKLGCSYIRISPILPKNTQNAKLFTSLHFRNAPIHMHAETIWVLNISKSEDELLLDMRKTTRNLIRRAIKDGVRIEISTNKRDLANFMKTYAVTAKREKFTPFSKTFITNEFEAFNLNNNAIILNSYLGDDKKCLSSAIIIFTKSTGFYHQGASLHSKFPVTYLMQWTAIKEAKKRGCHLYNFWGIAPTEDKDHPWYGLTNFKKGFGGYQIDYLPAQDYILSPKYYLSYLFEKIVRLKRRV